jgi:alkylhydroperoxidase family enzyme
LKAGGTQEKSDALKSEVLPTSVFDEKEQTLLALTDESTRGIKVNEKVIEKLKELIGETKTVEAVATVAGYNCVSRFLVALGI